MAPDDPFAHPREIIALHVRRLEYLAEKQKSVIDRQAIAMRWLAAVVVFSMVLAIVSWGIV